MMNFFKTIVDTIIEIENEFFNQPKAGETKKQRVIELINKNVDIPVIPEFLEEKILGVIIDLIVYLFNQYSLFNKS